MDDPATTMLEMKITYHDFKVVDMPVNSAMDSMSFEVLHLFNVYMNEININQTEKYMFNVRYAIPRT
jgi:hypothetical protein